MEFFIKKGADAPILKMTVVDDGKDAYTGFMKMLETATISFSMINGSTGVPKIRNARAYITDKLFAEPNAENEYYVYYRFSSRDTNKPGRYIGQFLINTDMGSLICPIREELYINIVDTIKQ